MTCPLCLVEMDEEFALNNKTGKRCPRCGKIDWPSLCSSEEKFGSGEALDCHPSVETMPE